MFLIEDLLAEPHLLGVYLRLYHNTEKGEKKPITIAVSRRFMGNGTTAYCIIPLSPMITLAGTFYLLICARESLTANRNFSSTTTTSCPPSLPHLPLTHPHRSHATTHGENNDRTTNSKKNKSQTTGASPFGFRRCP